MSDNSSCLKQNQIIRESLTEAVLRLMATRPLVTLTVAEVCRTAGVSCNVYYRSYDSIPDILREHLVTTWRSYASAHQDEYPAPEQLGELFCAYIYDERELISLLYQQGQMGLVEGILYEILGPVPGEAASSRYIKSCAAYWVYGIVIAMAAGGFAETPAEIKALLHTARPAE